MSATKSESNPVLHEPQGASATPAGALPRASNPTLVPDPVVEDHAPSLSGTHFHTRQDVIITGDTEVCRGCLQKTMGEIASSFGHVHSFKYEDLCQEMAAAEENGTLLRFLFDLRWPCILLIEGFGANEEEVPPELIEVLLVRRAERLPTILISPVPFEFWDSFMGESLSAIYLHQAWSENAFKVEMGSRPE